MPRKQCSSSLVVGGFISVTAVTFFGSGLIPSSLRMWPMYLISFNLIWLVFVQLEVPLLGTLEDFF